MEIEPVPQEIFFERKEILNSLEKRFTAFQQGYRQNVGLIGSLHTGKSSIVTQFLKNQTDPFTISILIRFEEADSFQVFCQKWLGGILRSYHRFLKLPAAHDFQSLVQQVRRRIPKVLKQMRMAREFAKIKQYDKSYRELLKLPLLLHQETGHKVLLVLDEFDSLNELPLKDPFAELGKEIMLQTNTMYVVISSQVKHAREIFKEKLSLLFSNFEVVEVGNLNFDEAKSSISSTLGAEFADSFLGRFLIFVTNGHPYYLDILIHRLKQSASQKKLEPFNQETLREVLECELFDHRGTLHQHFISKLNALSKNRSSSALSDVLLSIALEKKKMQLIALHLGRPVDEIKKNLQRLLEEGFIRKRGSFFNIPDFLFRFWLREAYHRKRVSFELDYGEERLAFRRSLKAFFDRVVCEDEKDLTLRIEELFKKFKNDLVEVDTGKMMCPRFTEIVSKPSNGRMFPVLAKSSHTSWLCQVVKDRLEENDVRLFLNDLGQLKNRVQKKLMIVLRGMDLNAKLLAKETNVQLWDLRDLNILLDLYGYSKVIL